MAAPIPLHTTLRLPDWIPQVETPQTSEGDEARMAFVIDLARRNVEQGTGGPFAAAVFDQVRGRLVSVGVNVVQPSQTAVAHAEIVAIALAGRAVGSFDCGADGPTELVTSTEPCAMCLGAVQWSGVSRLVYGAADDDAREVGFDEGYKPPGWVQRFEERGIEVEAGVLRQLAAGVLADYRDGGGAIYNARQGEENPGA